MTRAQRLGGTPLPGALSRRFGQAAVAVFLVGTFVWAWGLWGFWVGAAPPAGSPLSPALVLTAIAGGLAPSLAALATTWLVGGAGAVRDLLDQVTRWRHNFGWYAVALFLAPALALVSAGLQAVFAGPLAARAVAFPVELALAWALLAALGGEFGWRGFLLPRLQARFDILGAALAIGLVWGLWQLPAAWIGLPAHDGWSGAAALIEGPVLLAGHAIVMSWLWNRTHGSLLLMVFYHFALAASAMLIPAAVATGPAAVLAAGLAAVPVWLAAFALLIWRRQDF
ncbi:type II CAAX prenyl endopeptidase Rce1 family protein [Devosia sp.]|uniref:CPBP family glutamic-type intramembrane protease n=1 Tax=Devosia sp. TaxID=1871048 RepID=UPI002F0ED954